MKLPFKTGTLSVAAFLNVLDDGSRYIERAGSITAQGFFVDALKVKFAQKTSRRSKRQKGTHCGSPQPCFHWAL